MKRFLYSKIKDHLKKKQITLLLGARQVGKTTLLQQILADLKEKTLILRELWESYAKKEYRIVHPVDRILWKYVLINSQYGKPQISDNKGTPSFEKLPDFKPDLLKVFGIEMADSNPVRAPVFLSPLFLLQDHIPLSIHDNS